MTANQVAALRAQEERRHNERSEVIEQNKNVLHQAEIVMKAQIQPSETVKNRTQSIKNIADSFKAIFSPFSMF